MAIKHLLEEDGIVFTQDIPNGASYIFPDGSFLSMAENYNNGVFGRNGYKTGVHPDIDHFCQVQQLVRPNLKNALLHTDNAIKLQDAKIIKVERIHITLPPKPLTDIQYTKLEDWIYHLTDEKRTIDISSMYDTYYETFERYNHATGYGMTPKELIAEIRKVYKQ